MTVVTPSDRPKSIRNCCVIELFGGVFVLSCCTFAISVGIGAFVMGQSHISSFFLFFSLKIHWLYRSFYLRMSSINTLRDRLSWGPVSIQMQM